MYVCQIKDCKGCAEPYTELYTATPKVETSLRNTPLSQLLFKMNEK